VNNKCYYIPLPLTNSPEWVVGLGSHRISPGPHVTPGAEYKIWNESFVILLA